MKELSEHILDILHNSLSANATTVSLTITENREKDEYNIAIADNGKGIPPEVLQRVTDPYTTSRTTRKVGMGLPLFKMTAEQTGGTLSIESEVGKGTTVFVTMSHKNIDRPALGDIEGTLVLLASSFLDRRFIYHHITEKDTFTFDTEEIKQELDGVPMNNPQVIRFLKDMIKENLEAIGAER
ncbi:MAG: ATP-binding protein [Bacteroidales bacterium]|nr:ATP-binding protein [Bacteroidales bacterium]